MLWGTSCVLWPWIILYYPKQNGKSASHLGPCAYQSNYLAQNRGERNQFAYEYGSRSSLERAVCFGETWDCVVRQKPFGRADRKLFGNTKIRNSSDCCDELIITVCVSLGGSRRNWPLEEDTLLLKSISYQWGGPVKLQHCVWLMLFFHICQFEAQLTVEYNCH